MKKVLIAAIAAPAILCGAMAQAADLPPRSAPNAYYDAPTYAPGYNWTGFYLGGNAALGWGGYNGGGISYFGHPVGGAFGVTGGYNFQSGNLLVGLEGDYAWSHLSDARSPLPGAAASGQVTNIDTIRGRVGYVSDRTLVFLTGGYAGADIRGTLVSSSLLADETRYANGLALGLGLEYAFSQHVSAKAEYLYTALYGANYFGGSPSFITSGANINLLRAGLNYHF